MLSNVSNIQNRAYKIEHVHGQTHCFLFMLALASYYLKFI